MLYRITFFGRSVTEEQWQSFFSSYFRRTWIFDLKIFIKFENDFLSFYVDSQRDLAALNPKTYPLYFVPEPSITVPSPTTGGVGVLLGRLIDVLVRSKAKKEHGTFSVLEFTIRRFSNGLPGIVKVFFTLGEALGKFYDLRLSACSRFLSFDLSEILDIDIPKVYPELKRIDIARISKSETGMFYLPHHQDFKINLTSFDFWKHSLIVGQSGSGKSKLLELMIRDLYTSNLRNDYSVVLIDPHGVMHSHFDHIEDKKVLDFQNSSINLFTNTANPLSATELTMKLFSSIIDIENNQKMQRLLKYSLFGLYKVKQMTLDNLRKLLTDTLYRKQISKEVEQENIQQFFDTEFMEIYNKFYSEAVLPILNVISEFSFLNFQAEAEPLESIVSNNFLTIASIPQVALGDVATKLLGASIIQQLFLLSQSGVLKKKVLLMIDEVSLIQNPSLPLILSEARKFGLSIMMVQQYLKQVSVTILNSIFSNVANYYSFRVGREDAEMLMRNMQFEINEVFLARVKHPREIEEMGIKMLLELNVGECIVKVMKDAKFMKPFKVGTCRIES